MTRLGLLLRHPLLWLLVLLGVALIAWAGALGGRRQVEIGATSERFYLRSGFYDVEQGPTGDYRWTQPDATIVLTSTGPSPLSISLTIFDASPIARPLRLSLDGNEIYRGATGPGGTPWALTVHANATTASPLLTISTTPWRPPNDSRELGVALIAFSVDSPGAAGRAYLAEGLLLLSVLALALAVAARTGEPTAPFIAALAALGFFGPLIAYGDLWLTQAVPLLAIPAIAAALFLYSPRRAAGTRGAAWGALGLAGLLMMLTLGRFNSGDAEGMFQVTAGLVEDGVPWQHLTHTWIKFGLGQPLATAPLYWLGSAWAEEFRADQVDLARFAVALFNALIVPATALVLYLAALRRYGRRVALALAATFLLATPAVVYARLAFAEPLSGLLILFAFVLLWEGGLGRSRFQTRPYLYMVAAAGVCLGLAVLVKPANAIYLPVPAVYLAWRLAWENGQATGTGWRSRGSLVLPGLLLLGLGMLPGLLLTAFYNYLRYSSVFTFGYDGEGFTTPLPVGLYGLLFSPGKSLFLYAPPLLLMPFALLAVWRQREPLVRAEVLAISAQAAIVLVFHALWSSWEGNIAWGPRLILPLVPLLIWPLGRLAGSARARVAWWTLGVLGFLVTVPGALVDQFYYFDINGVYGAGTQAEAKMLFDPAWSPIIAHWRFLLAGTREALDRPALAGMGLSPVWDTILPVAFGLLALFALWRALSGVSRVPG